MIFKLTPVDDSVEFSLNGTGIHAGVDPEFGQGGSQVLRPKVADIAKQSHVSEVSNLWPGSRACLRALEAFGFLMLKYAFSHILEILFLLIFDIYFNTKS